MRSRISGWISNRDDDSSFERVVNKPTRGIGARTVELMRAYARAHAVSLWRAAGAIASEDLNGRAGERCELILVTD